MHLEYPSAAVTGGAGFIGSNLCEALVEQGVEVTCIDNLVAGKMENIANLLDRPNFRFAEVDVTGLDALVQAFEGCDIVFHNAASKNTVCQIDPELDLRVNGWGGWCVAEAARRTGVQKVVHASTGSVYGELREHPQTEEHPLAPRSFYGNSKLAGENYLRSHMEYHGAPRYSVLRYFHVYGPRQESGEFGGVIPIFIRRALAGEPLVIYGDGSQVRSFTFVLDDVNANIALANSRAADGEIYNAASGIKVTVLELAHKILRLLDREDLDIRFEPWRAGDIRNFDVDNAKISSVGVAFPTGFDDGLQQTLAWYRDYFAA
jgi:UDP-glucose 4-epimerase